ncbi:hypothetical protein Tcan_03868 [Toxocara canis]|uniref:Uncharacterized protein n=1 Tax=Toxocara canis TaxID=6265 RepID=A0A0B2V6T6_TOXCA|nr:hypothetical protein Tcan_03868 [Toxocara canis]
MIAGADFASATAVEPSFTTHRSNQCALVVNDPTPIVDDQFVKDTSRIREERLLHYVTRKRTCTVMAGINTIASIALIIGCSIFLKTNIDIIRDTEVKVTLLHEYELHKGKDKCEIEENELEPFHDMVTSLPFFLYVVAVLLISLCVSRNRKPKTCLN